MTNQTIGLQWGFQSLTAAPFTIPAKDPNYTYNQVIILLTDGLNTQSRFSTTASDHRPAHQEGLRQHQGRRDHPVHAACQHRWRSGIHHPAAMRERSGKYFTVTSAGQINQVFSQIGTQLSRLRIAK